jgi:hypothetical protein
MRERTNERKICQLLFSLLISLFGCPKIHAAYQNENDDSQDPTTLVPSSASDASYYCSFGCQHLGNNNRDVEESALLALGGQVTRRHSVLVFGVEPSFPSLVISSLYGASCKIKLSFFLVLDWIC